MNFFKLPVSLLLVFSFFLSSVVPSYASTGEVQEIFDRFHYTMAVEWDQKDPVFKNKAQDDLLQTLIQSDVSVEDLNAYLKASVDPETGKELKRLIDSLKASNVSPEKAGMIAADFMDKKYSEGVNFNGKGPERYGHGGKDGHGYGGMIITVLVVVVIVQIIVIHSSSSNNHQCSRC